MPFLFENGLVIREDKIFLNAIKVFCYSVFFSLFRAKAWPIICPLPKNACCQVLLKLALKYSRIFLISVKVISPFPSYFILSLGKGC